MSEDFDVIEKPKHYNSHPSGGECIEIIEWFPANLANAWKYLYRVGLKDEAIQEMSKALWYIKKELKRRTSLSRQQVLLDFYCPNKLNDSLRKFLKKESGKRREFFCHVFEAVANPTSNINLKVAEKLLIEIIGETNAL